LRALAARNNRRTSDHEHEQQGIADRIRKIRGNGRRVAADRVQDRIECKAGAQGRGTQTRYGTVEPRRDSHSGNMLARQEYERDIDNGIETQPEQIGE
jgi:hypothetical protein